MRIEDLVRIRRCTAWDIVEGRYPSFILNVHGQVGPCAVLHHEVDVSVVFLRAVSTIWIGTLTKQSSKETILRCDIAFRILISLSKFSSSFCVSFCRETALIAIGARVFCMADMGDEHSDGMV